MTGIFTDPLAAIAAATPIAQVPEPHAVSSTIVPAPFTHTQKTARHVPAS
jgi:hypothetical protein